jgi:hypothetical protein
MRTFCQRMAMPHRHERHSSPEEPKEAPLDDSAATLITVTAPDAKSEATTPRRPPASPIRDGTPKSDKKQKKSKSEQFAERHAKKSKNPDGQNGSKAGKQGKPGDKAPSGAPKVTPKAPGSNGKVVLFVRAISSLPKKLPADANRCHSSITRPTSDERK